MNKLTTLDIIKRLVVAFIVAALITIPFTIWLKRVFDLEFTIAVFMLIFSSYSVVITILFVWDTDKDKWV